MKRPRWSSRLSGLMDVRAPATAETLAGRARSITSTAICCALVGCLGLSSAAVAQQWQDVELAPPLVVRGQAPMAQAPVVYFDQDPTRAMIGPPPPGTQMAGQPAYGMASDNLSPMFFNKYVGVFGEFLYLHPRGADVPFAVPQDGTGAIGTTPAGPVAVADLGYEPGFRAGGFFTLTEDSLIELTYSWYESQTSNSVASTAPLVINPLTLFPGTFNAGFTAEQAVANYAIDFQFIDADYMVMGYCCPHFWFGYLLGARYADLTQTFSATYPFAPPDGTTSVNTNIDFTGAGIRLGLIGERALLPDIGFRAYGSGILNVLVGQFDASYTQANQFNGVEASTAISEDRIVPVVDLELGLAWLSPGGHLRLSAGYMISAWFNSVTMPVWIDAVQDRSFSPSDEVLTFDGLTARAQLAF